MFQNHANYTKLSLFQEFNNNLIPQLISVDHRPFEIIAHVEIQVKKTWNRPHFISLTFQSGNGFGSEKSIIKL